MNQQLNALDYKFGLESLKSSCLSVENGTERVWVEPITTMHAVATTAPITAASPVAPAASVATTISSSTLDVTVTTMPVAIGEPTAIVGLAAIAEPAATKKPTTIADANESLEAITPNTPVPLAEPAENANYASVPTTTVFAGRFVPSENNIAALDSAAFHPSGGMKTTFGRRKRLAPCSASTEDTNELISAFTRSANSLELQEQKETDAKESSSLGMAPNAVAYSGEVSSSQFQLSTPFENDLESTKREGSIFAQSPFQKLPVLARQAADAPALGTKETAEQEARAICSIKRGIKVFTILGSFLLVVLVYECTKQSIFRTMADSAAAIGANTLALNIFDTQLSKDKASLSMLTEWASKDQARGRIAKAMSYYSRAIALDPKDYVLFLNRAVLNFDLRQLKEAIADDNKAIALSPNCALAYNNRGLAYRSEGNYNQALADFNKAIALSSTQPRNSFWLNRGMCFLHMRRYKEAIQDFNLATQHGNETAKNMKAIAIMQAKHIHRLEATVNSSRHHHHS